MKLIVGLGNPEPKYNLTRHNVGFLLLDHIARERHGTWQDKPKFKAVVAELQFDDEKALLIKPTTYYNQTGEAVRLLTDFYKLSSAQDVLVLHDELALPFGTLRTRLRGSDAGNNGIKSIIAHIDEAFARIRVGVANDLTPQMDKADFVLERFSTDEQQELHEVAQHAMRFVEDFVHHEREFALTSVKVQKDQP